MMNDRGASQCDKHASLSGVRALGEQPFFSGRVLQRPETKVLIPNQNIPSSSDRGRAGVRS